MPTKTQREREAAQRKAKLDRIKEQVDDGSLVIRQMTDAERKRFAKDSAADDAEAAKRRDRRNRRRKVSRPLPPARRS
jgi:ribosomal protein L9